MARFPWLEPDGSFGVDTSDLPLRIGEWGVLTLSDAQGNTTQFSFRITGFPAYLPFVFQQ